MPIRAAPLFAEFAPLLREATAGIAPELWFDAHTHIGENDPDGTKATIEEIADGLDASGHARALVFPMHEPDGYPPANDMVCGEVAKLPERFEWLCRVDPKADGAVEELRRNLARGARGLKLHPRSDSFGLPHPVVDELVAECAKERRPVLFHAGRGIPNLGLGAADLARRHPGTPIILAHAGISDLGLLADAALELDNLYFDTAWWNVSDVLQLVATIPPGRILYASDMPYGIGLYPAFLLTRCAQQVGLPADVLRTIAGAQLQRLLDGEDPIDLGPAPGLTAVGARDVRCERVAMHASAVMQIAFRGGDPAESIAIARLGCQFEGHDDRAGEILAACDAVLAAAPGMRERYGDEPMAMAPPAMVAQAIAGTPDVPAPDIASVPSLTQDVC